MIGVNKQVVVNGVTFRFLDFLWDPDKYMNLIRPLFRSSTLVRKDDEGRRTYLSRIFSSLYYNKKLGVDYHETTPTVQDNVESADDIMSAFGIEVVKHNPKWSRVIFKSSGNSRLMSNEEIDLLATSIKERKSFSRKQMNLKAGIELEFIGSNHIDKVRSFCDKMTELVGKSKFSSPLRYNHNSGSKWVLGTDGSLRTTYDERGYELTTPILNMNSEKDLDKLSAVLDLIKSELDGYTNNSCGTHMHISFACESASRNLCDWFANSYKKNESTLFDKVVPKRRAGNRAYYCRSVNTNYIWNRFQKINFNNVELNSQELHLEFRQLDGTLDFNKIVSWFKLQKMFCELTMASWREDTPLPEMELNSVICDRITFGQSDVETLLVMNGSVR